MATSRPARGARRTPAGPAWDEVSLAPIVLIRAGEELLADRAVSRLLAQARQQDPATEVITVEAATYEAHQLDTLVSPSLFGEPKLVLVPALEQMTDALLTDLLTYVSAPAPDVAVVLRHNGGQRGKKLLDALTKSPYPVATIQAVKSPKDKAALVAADVRRAGRRMEPAAVGALVDALGTDLRELCSAAEQLIADTQGTITVDTVNTYYAGRFEATGFTVADAAAAGNVAKAVTALRHALATGTDPVPIVAALAMKIRQLARVAAMGGRRGLTARDLGMAPWQAERARRELSGWSDDALAVAIQAVARADAEVKGASRDSVYAVERAVLTICDARRGRLPGRGGR
ncbi:DNA polymerase III subunit delta [Actinomyces ruminicola]|uniref:DNA-directed DNA polymerase n=1 Tax=Actinomyces ruminicola TaxID=332524 RepID=A0A1G9VIC3_9ACTO|nr:DNA polymerase III subunit delta [Actinomyces ruminicola]SDM71866.1 DNA polymerase III, delta subunit [Actinomyces ruminicola]